MTEDTAIPLPLKVFAVLCILVGVGALPLLILSTLATAEALLLGSLSFTSVTSVVLVFILDFLLLVLSVVSILLGTRLLRDKRHLAAVTVNFLIVIIASAIVCDIMLNGLSFRGIFYSAFVVILIAFASYLDPSLSGERKLQRALRKMEDRTAAEELRDRLGRDLSGKNYITLNFFNVFWIFLICCIVGLIIETVFFAIVYGGFHNRSGMLFGPFSPIYGFGGLLITLALNRFYNKSIIIIFLVSALIGGSFEFLVSWFLEFAFGITAWDYTGSFFSIGGRTSALFMIFWGLLGIFWIKILLPTILRLINLIPWNWRYALTTICATVIIINGAATLMSLDLWYERLAGNMPTLPVEVFFNTYFDDEYMQHHFQSMTINPDITTRL